MTPQPPKHRATPEELAWRGLLLAGKYRLDRLIAGRRGELIYEGTESGSLARVMARIATGPGDDPVFLARHARDASVLKSLSASVPGLASVLGAGRARHPVHGKATAFVVVEMLEGRTLATQIEERRGQGEASLSEAIVVFEPLATALARMHAEGLAHRAFAPTSVVCSESGGRAIDKIVDVTLGANDASSDPEPRLSPLDLRHGAPEHFKRSYGATGPATDVFCLALCLVEFLSGKPALQGDEPADLYLEASNLHSRPTPRARGFTASDGVEAVFQRALAVDPRRRHPSAGEFWAALKAAAEGRASSLPLPRLSAMPSAPRPSGRGRAALRILGLVLLLSALGGASVWFSRRPRPAPSAAPATSAPAPSAVLATAAPAPSTAPMPSSAPAPASGSASVSSPPLSFQARDSAADADVPGPGSGRMIHVPAASFPMGSDRGGRAERPMHKVTLSRSFEIDLFEVTTRSYEGCVAAGKCPRATVHYGPGAGGHQKNCNAAATRPAHPVNCVDHLQAMAYCAFVGKRLPTEAEWELAARGTDGREYPWGDAAPHSCAQAILHSMSEGPCVNKLETSQVGLTPEGTSPFGVYDMAGNVWEWVQDGYSDYSSAEATDPFVPPSQGLEAKGVLRGGSFDYAVHAAKTSARLGALRAVGHISTGFRCARDGT